VPNLKRSVTTGVIAALIISVLVIAAFVGATYIAAGTNYVNTLELRAAENGFPLRK
jgi:hypothetical protein